MPRGGLRFFGGRRGRRDGLVRMTVATFACSAFLPRLSRELTPVVISEHMPTADVASAVRSTFATFNDSGGSAVGRPTDEEEAEEMPDMLSMGAEGVGLLRMLRRHRCKGNALGDIKGVDGRTSSISLALRVALWLGFVSFSAGSYALLVYAVLSGLLPPPDSSPSSPEGRQGASEALGCLEYVSYDPLLFADPSDPADSRPPRECCCCGEEYAQGKRIVRTSCSHFFHKECLCRWLQRHQTCPLCRLDLAAAAAIEARNGLGTISMEPFY